MLHRWVGAESREWACAAYDHGPFCRLCQDVTNDEVAKGCLELVEMDLFEVKCDSNGKLQFRATSMGQLEAQELIEKLAPDD